MAYISNSPDLGLVDLYLNDTVGPGALKLSGSAIAYGRNEFPGGVIRGVDPVLGGGEFMFVQFAGTVAAGGVVELTITSVSSGARMDVSAIAWAGTALKGKPLGIAMSGGASGTWGWVQVSGIAVANVSGTVASGDQQFWQASGVISSTGVASKAVINALAVSANGATYGSGSQAVVLPSTQALVLVNRPSGQGPIT
jgi:hypothetical protein